MCQVSLDTDIFKIFNAVRHGDKSTLTTSKALVAFRNMNQHVSSIEDKEKKLIAAQTAP